MHKIILQLLLIFTFVSCSIYKNNRETIKDDVDFSKRPEHNSKDYGAQFRYLKTPYLNTSGVKALDLRFRSQIYLEQIATQIEKQNELFFTNQSHLKRSGFGRGIATQRFTAVLPGRHARPFFERTMEGAGVGKPHQCGDRINR